jgi:tyrosyl-tRNA synthetase
MIIKDEKQIDEVLERGVSEVINKKSLKERLLSGKQLRIKFGIDPTSPNIHIGRAVALLKLKDFQNLGHKIILLVGNATGVIGDTSDKESERPMLTYEKVAENMKSYIDQAGKIINIKDVEVVYNADWLDKLGYKEIGEHADCFSVHDFISRENIKKRLDEGKRVSLREVLYPLMQGYDSVQLKADVELGGNDQRFNLLAGRVLQEKFGQKPQDVLMMNLILGTDGRKMSSSWGNTINLTDSPNDMYGKIMSIPDNLIENYFIHCTRVSLDEVEELMKLENPRDVKMQLAFEITKIYHGEEKAKEAEENFKTQFQKREVPENIEEFEISLGLGLLNTCKQIGFTSSNSETRRKLEEGAIKIDESIINDPNYIFDKAGKFIIKLGRKIAKLNIK